MRIIVIDTETTGLPTTRGNVINDVEELKKWPYIIQLSFIVFDTNKNKICHEHDFIISIPDNVKISSRSIELHGISRKISNN